MCSKPITNKLLCHVRNAWVVATPEEQLRQRVLHYMLNKGNYPKGLIALEAPLRLIDNPRRADIISYYKSPHGELLPLLVVECKAIKITEAMLQQVGGYNHFLNAPFIALSNQKESYWGWFDKSTKNYRLSFGFPSFDRLISLISTD